MSFSEKVQVLIEHYDALPKTRSGVPSRRDINPAQIKDIISWCMIAVSRSPRLMELTLCGTSIERILGIHMQGINMFDTYSEEDKDRYEQVFKLMFTQPCGIKLDRIFTSQTAGEKHLTMIGLPLSNSDGIVDRMIGVVNTPERPKSDLMMELGDTSDLLLTKTLSFEVFDIGHGVPERDFLQPILIPK
jgi:hypothetical protein